MRLTEFLLRAVTCFVPEESGVSLMEYALVGLLVAIVCILALLAIGKHP